MKRQEKIALLSAILLIAVIYISDCVLNRIRFNEKAEITAVIYANELKGKGLVTGYCYYLLENYAKHCKSDIRILLPEADSCEADISAIPVDSAAAYGEGCLTRPIDSLFVFASQNPKRITFMEAWFERFLSSDEHASAHKAFFANYDPIKKASHGQLSQVLSPYDDIIKAYADSIGWDWRMLMAVVFQESRFHIEATSRRGARGLMQMMPRTADKMDTDDLLSPEQSIRAGALYLKEISRLYRRRAGNETEKYKFTLAAYNAGIGRMKDILNFAASRGVQTNNWDSLCMVIPEMQDSSLIAQLDTVKLGTFKGGETTFYVERVMQLYDAFRQICP